VLLLHSGTSGQMWLFFDDEDLEFPGGIGSMTSTTDDESQEILAAPPPSPSHHHHQIIRFPNLQTPKKDKTKPQIGNIKTLPKCISSFFLEVGD
jgi:hypothetical protein